jgi:hypothetical protein
MEKELHSNYQQEEHFTTNEDIAEELVLTVRPVGYVLQHYITRRRFTCAKSGIHRSGQRKESKRNDLHGRGRLLLEM